MCKIPPMGEVLNSGVLVCFFLIATVVLFFLCSILCHLRGFFGWTVCFRLFSACGSSFCFDEPGEKRLAKVRLCAGVSSTVERSGVIGYNPVGGTTKFRGL